MHKGYKRPIRVRCKGIARDARLKGLADLCGKPAKPGTAGLRQSIPAVRCAGEDLNLHGVLTPQGPQPCASTNSATSARRDCTDAFPRSGIRVRLVRALCEEAVAAALAAGASYADARAIVRRSQLISSKNRRLDQVDDVESEGIGVRVLVDGAWGFACDRRVDETGARDAAERATSFAKAAPGKHERALAPVEPVQGE